MYVKQLPQLVNVARIPLCDTYLSPTAKILLSWENAEMSTFALASVLRRMLTFRKTILELIFYTDSPAAE